MAPPHFLNLRQLLRVLYAVIGVYEIDITEEINHGHFENLLGIVVPLVAYSMD